jgi:hypothetical protein
MALPNDPLTWIQAGEDVEAGSGGNSAGVTNRCLVELLANDVYLESLATGSGLLGWTSGSVVILYTGSPVTIISWTWPVGTKYLALYSGIALDQLSGGTTAVDVTGQAIIDITNSQISHAYSGGAGSGLVPGNAAVGPTVISTPHTFLVNFRTSPGINYLNVLTYDVPTRAIDIQVVLANPVLTNTHCFIQAWG